MATPNWNVEFWKNVLKPANSLAWPALSLGGGLVHLGDYGVLPSVGSGFRYAGNLYEDGVLAAWDGQPIGSWSLNWGKFVQTAAGVSVSGNYWDAETDTEVTAGIGFGWKFEGGESILANLPQTNSRQLSQPAQVLSQVGTSGTPLWKAATSLGYVKNNQLQPGFAVVTAVFEIIAGFVVCTTVNQQQWSISGVANAMSLFMGGEVGGYYGYASEIEATQVYIWPQQPLTKGDTTQIAAEASQATIAYLAYQWNGKGGFAEYQPH